MEELFRQARAQVSRVGSVRDEVNRRIGLARMRPRQSVLASGIGILAVLLIGVAIFLPTLNKARPELRQSENAIPQGSSIRPDNVQTEIVGNDERPSVAAESHKIGPATTRGSDINSTESHQ
jgi:hypothetical protein